MTAKPVTNPVLPDEWCETVLGEVAESMKNGLYKKAEAYADDGVPCLRMYNIDAGKIVWRDVKRMRLTDAELVDYELLPGDLLVNRVNSRELVGKTALIPGGMERSVFESKNIRLRLDKGRVVPAFINYQLLAFGNRYFDSNAQQVVGMASVSQKQLANFPIVLPPIERQRVIVAEIEKQFSRLDEAVANLKRVKVNLKRYKAAVLKAAVTGELTKEWRAKHASKLDAQGGANAAGGRKPGAATEEWRAAQGRASVAGGHDSMDGGGRVKQDARAEEPGATKSHPDVEPASKLLDRILAERRAKWEEAELAKMEAKGKAPKNDKWKAKYKEPLAPDTADLPELPAGWMWTTLGSLLSRIEAGKSFKCEERPPREEEVGVVKVSAVTWGEFDEAESKTCLDGSPISKNLFVRTGDFLFSRANTIELVGACVIAKEVNRNVMLSDKILRFELLVGFDEWVLYVLRSMHGRAEIERLATGNQESMRNIGQERIRAIRIPLPSITERDFAVTEVDRHLSLIHETETQVDTNLQRAERMRQSILSRAFSGELVNNDLLAQPMIGG